MIIASAIVIEKNDEVCILMGRRHCDCIAQLAVLKVQRPWKELEQGFVTHEFQFLNRIDAKNHARDCGQLMNGRLQNNNHKELYSEDLW